MTFVVSEGSGTGQSRTGENRQSPLSIRLRHPATAPARWFSLYCLGQPWSALRARPRTDRSQQTSFGWNHLALPVRSQQWLAFPVRPFLGSRRHLAHLLSSLTSSPTLPWVASIPPPWKILVFATLKWLSVFTRRVVWTDLLSLACRLFWRARPILPSLFEGKEPCESCWMGLPAFLRAWKGFWILSHLRGKLRPASWTSKLSRGI